MGVLTEAGAPSLPHPSHLISDSVGSD